MARIQGAHISHVIQAIRRLFAGLPRMSATISCSPPTGQAQPQKIVTSKSRPAADKVDRNSHGDNPVKNTGMRPWTNRLWQVAWRLPCRR